MVWKVMFGYYYYFLYVCTYYIEPFEEFLYLFLEYIGTIKNPIVSFWKILISPWKYDSTDIFFSRVQLNIIIPHV